MAYMLGKKSRIRETKHLLTDAESSTDSKKNPANDLLIFVV